MQTDFQQRIRAYVSRCPNQSANTWQIAQGAFPERWTKKTGRARSGRAALIGHIHRAARKDGLVCWRTSGIHGVIMIAIGGA